MSQFDGSTQRLEEDFAREAKFRKVAQACTQAITASYDERTQEADQHVADARHHWDASDEIGAFLLEADYAQTDAEAFRHALREAGQLLDARVDYPIRFDSGGELA